MIECASERVYGMCDEIWGTLVEERSVWNVARACAFNT